jgi:ubiquinone/menaquinone biosynthesis C-methylase UbiE/uncharacterized protein YbaR (Trm112 family)
MVASPEQNCFCAAGARTKKERAPFGAALLTLKLFQEEYRLGSAIPFTTGRECKQSQHDRQAPRSVCRIGSEAMKEGLLELLACPSCRSHMVVAAIYARAGGEIVEGALACAGCELRVPIAAGIPTFVTPEEQADHVAKSFGFEWQLHQLGGFEKETVFGRSVDEDVAYFYEGLAIEKATLKGTILDLGCGSGALTIALARRNPGATLVGVDIIPALEHVYRAGAGLPNLHLVRASVFALPLRDGAFDYAWSNGVLHHTGQTREAFTALTRKVKPGGRAYVWLYEHKLSPMVALRLLLIPLGLRRWNHRFLYRFCEAMAAPTWIAVKALRGIARLKAVRSNRHLRILTMDRRYRQLVLTWFDVLSPKYRDTVSETTLEAWFAESGFRNMVRYNWPVGVSATR